MTKKDRRIADLEREADRLTHALRLADLKVAARDQQIARLAQRPPSLTEQAKRKWNDLMRGVGL